MWAVAILVAGLGYIGAALAEDLLRAGERVVGIDNGFATDRAALARLAEQSGFRLVEGSVTAARTVARAFVREPIEVVYQLAAQASGHPAAAPPRYTELTNLSGPRVVLDAATRHGVPRVVYASSLRVYGGVLPPCVDEATPYGQQGDLAHLSHVYGEKLLELYARRAGLTAVAVRLAVVYGRGPVTKTDYRFMTVPNKFCLQVARGEPLEVYPGAATATGFIHLADACAALRAAAAAPWPPGFHAANAVGEICTVPALAAAVVNVARARGLAATVRGAGDDPLPAPTRLADSPSAATPTVDSRPARTRVVDPRPAATPDVDSPPTADPAAGAVNGAGVTIRSRLAAGGWRPAYTFAESLGPLLDYFRAPRRLA
jgi:nucleoside-diphosphate-sugar epimerase